MSAVPPDEAEAPPGAPPDSEAPALVLPPVSRRVQAGVRRMSRTIAWAQRLGEPRCAPPLPSIEIRLRALAVVDGEPDHMTALRTGAEPRPLDRPGIIEEQLTRITPQFFLRNTRRLERHGDTRISDWEYNVLRDEGWRDDLAASRSLRPAERPIDASTGRDALVEQVAQRQKLVVDTPWHQLFGRREPSGTT